MAARCEHELGWVIVQGINVHRQPQHPVHPNFPFILSAGPQGRSRRNTWQALRLRRLSAGYAQRERRGVIPDASNGCLPVPAPARRIRHKANREGLRAVARCAAPVWWRHDAACDQHLR